LVFALGGERANSESRFSVDQRMLPLRPCRARSENMTLCPIAIVAGCKKCPAFALCPLKSVIGDAPPPSEAKPVQPPKTKKKD
jgi:hypothetical protein